MNTKLFLGNLHHNITEQEIRILFGKFGHITDIDLPKEKGFGFINFEKSEAAQNALLEMNDYENDGKKMKVELALNQDNIKNHDSDRRPGFNSNQGIHSRGR